MIARNKVKQSGVNSLPGGEPQGTLLGLLLIIILINDVRFGGQMNNTGDLITSQRKMKTVNGIHLKFVDDPNLVEAINLPEKIISVSINEIPLPDEFHARTGHILLLENSNMFN